MIYQHYTDKHTNNDLPNTTQTNIQTMIYKTLHKKLKIEQHKPHLKQTIIYKTLHRKLKIEQHEFHSRLFHRVPAATSNLRSPYILVRVFFGISINAAL